MSDPPAVIWHDLECGGYREDLALWTALTREAGGRVLDIGAGTGRVSLHLARAGHEVLALDRDAELLTALDERARAEGLDVQTVCADACDFQLDAPVGLAIVPMQTVQLLAGAPERLALLGCVRAVLTGGSRLAFAIADALETFEVSDDGPAPLADVGEFDGTVYSSRPLAVRAEKGGFVLERRRETVTADGTLSTEPDRVRLQALTPAGLEAEGRRCGFSVAPRRAIATTAEYVGSAVVVLDA